MFNPLEATVVGDLSTIGTVLNMVRESGGMLVLTLFSIAGNVYFVRQIMTGKLVRGELHKDAVKELRQYRKEVKEVDTENWKRVLGYLGNLKAVPSKEEVSKNGESTDQ